MFSPMGTNYADTTPHDNAMSVSPVNPGSGPYNVSSPFLPGYLLGDHQLHQHHGLVRQAASGLVNIEHPDGKSSPRLWSAGGSHSPSQRQSGPGTSMSHSPSSSSLARRESTRTRHGAPPVKSLYSSPPTVDGTAAQLSLAGQNRSTSSPALRAMTSGPMAPTGMLHTPGGGSRGDTSLLGTSFGPGIPTSPAQSDPFYTQGDLKADDILDETWVTVFGFPPGATSFILQQFAQYGTIIKHVVASECNWMHIHYQSKIQAKKALSKDGKVYGGCMKIGVTPCIEKDIMEEKENQSVMSPAGPNRRCLAQSNALNSSSLTPIRPLTAAYAASKGEYNVLQEKHTPRRDASLVSKLKEYMFGY